MAARCPVCERMIENQSIWRSWRGMAGNYTLVCPHCGQVLKLTSRSGVLIGVAVTGISLALLPLEPILRAHGMSMVWFVPLICVVICLLSVFLFLKLGRYEKHTTVSIR